MKNKDYRLLKAFSKEGFSEHIYPIYKEHENTFDKDGIHGVLHIGRSIIASFILACKCKELKLDNDIQLKDTIIATAFHDSGRKNNGDDHWEGISAEKCRVWIHQMNTKHDEYITHWTPEVVASHIVKRNVGDFTPFEAICLHDADCLEIMRECTGRGGINGFIREYLLLYNKSNELKVFLDKLINEWYEFICQTEANKASFSVPSCLSKLIRLLKYDKEKRYPLINSFLC